MQRAAASLITTPLLALALLGFLVRVEDVWLFAEVYWVVALGACAMVLLGLSVPEEPQGRANKTMMLASVVLGGGALAVVLVRLSGTLAVAGLSLLPVYLVWFLYQRALAAGQSRVLIPLEAVSALGMVLAVALPLAEQRGRLPWADPTHLSRIAPEQFGLETILLYFDVFFNSLGSLLGDANVLWLVALVFVQRLLLCHGRGVVSPPTSAAAASPFWVMLSPALVLGLAAGAGVYSLAQTPGAARTILLTVASASLLVLLVVRMIPAASWWRRPVLDLTLALPFLIVTGWNG